MFFPLYKARSAYKNLGYIPPWIIYQQKEVIWSW